MIAGWRLVLLPVTVCLAHTHLPAQTTAPATTAPAATAPATTGPATLRPITSPSIPELEPLIVKLSDSDWKVRTAAQDAIVALGDDVTLRLQQLQNQSDDAEVRTAAESMLARIAQGRLTGPTLVTLHLTDAPAQQAFAELGRQVNAELRIWPEGLWQHHKPGPVTIDADRKPFWLVLKELCAKTLVTPREMGQGEPFTLMQGSNDQMHGIDLVSGAFLLVANSATESTSIRYGREAAHPNTSLSVMITCFGEPKLKILARSNQPIIDEAVDESGHSLAVPSSPANEAINMHSSERQFNFLVQLRKPDAASRKLARLKGRFRAVVEARSERLEINDVLKSKGSTNEIAGRRVIIGDVTESARNYQLKLTILRDRRDPRRGGGPSWQDNLNINAIQLLDANGKPLRRGGYGGGGSSEKLEYEVTFTRDRDGLPPAKLVWELPVEAREIDVPFEFKDLPLP